MEMRVFLDTINKKILIPVLSLAFLLLIGLGVFMTQNNRLTMQAMMNSKGDGIADIFTKFSADYFAFFDFQDFENIVNAMQADPDIDHAVIFNKDNEPLTQVKETSENMPNLMIVQREIKDKDGNLLGSMKIAFKKDRLQTSLKRNIILVASSLFVALLFFSISMFMLVRKFIAEPIGRTKQMIQEFEQGHLGTRLNMKQLDEIGQMARSMDSFSESLEHEFVGSLKKMAEGNLAFSLNPKDDRDVLRGTLVKTCRDLNILMEQIDIATDQMATGSGQVTDSSQSLSQGASQQATSLEEISSSLMQMSSQTRTNAENANRANDLAMKAREAASKGNSQMEDMVTAMSQINDASQSISKIIKVIDEIAFQTNLLALNAAVEAARAGKHGKGFAVVAEEVRSLAARSAKAARETAALIEGSVEKVANGSEVANQTAQALDEIGTGIIQVSELIKEIASASNEQAEGIAQINKGLDQIDHVTQQNTALAEESAAAAEELAAQAAQLQEMLNRFTLRRKRTVKKQTAQRTSQWQLPEPSGEQADIEDFEDAQGGRKRDARQDYGRVIALDDNEFGKY
jgi:methyl-accepting chemotaxis protein